MSSQEIEILASDGQYLPDTFNCPTIDMTVKSCILETSVLTNAPYNLQFDDLVVLRARTTNFYGTSNWSTLNTDGARIKRIPTKMGPISVIEKTETEITISWSLLSGSEATGNSDILAYNLYWDKGSESQPNIKLISTLDTQFQIKGTVGGVTYKFVIAAENIFGEGQLSDQLVQVASDVPDQIQIAETYIDGTQVVVEWDPPFSNYKPILEYEIIFLTNSGAYINILPECDG